MECVIPAKSTKVFFKAIQSLSKIGSELCIKATSDDFSIRTVNDTKSAFASFSFFPKFFTSYTLDASTNSNSCRISVKSCLGIFRNMKGVEHCKIVIDHKNSKLIVQLKCRLETLKTHSISIIDEDTLHAVYAKENLLNKILGDYKIFVEISNNFQMNEEEITLEASIDKLIAKNFVEGAQLDHRFMRSQLTLRADEFEKYSVKNETSITFCLREFRALLSFAESINLPLTLCFENSGRPMILVVESLQIFEMNLVMSTLSEDDISRFKNDLNTSSLTVANNESSEHCTSRKRNNEKSDNSRSKKSRIEDDGVSATQSNLSSGVEKGIESKSRLQARRNSTAETESCPLLMETNEKEMSDMVFVTFRDTETESNSNSETMISLNEKNKKKAEAIFQKCFESTFNIEQLSTYNQILANNSDTDD